MLIFSNARPPPMMLCWQEDVTEKVDEKQVDDSEEDVWRMINLHQFMHFQRYARNAKIGLIKYNQFHCHCEG